MTTEIFKNSWEMKENHFLFLTLKKKSLLSIQMGLNKKNLCSSYCCNDYVSQITALLTTFCVCWLECLYTTLKCCEQPISKIFSKGFIESSMMLISVYAGFHVFAFMQLISSCNVLFNASYRRYCL